MTRRPRQIHSPPFTAKIAAAVLDGNKIFDARGRVGDMMRLHQSLMTGDANILGGEKIY